MSLPSTFQEFGKALTTQFLSNRDSPCNIQNYGHFKKMHVRLHQKAEGWGADYPEEKLIKKYYCDNPK